MAPAYKIPGARRTSVVSAKLRHLTSGKEPIPIVQEAGWAPGLVWTGEENLTATGIPFAQYLARSECIVQLRDRVNGLQCTEMVGLQEQ